MNDSATKLLVLTRLDCPKLFDMNSNRQEGELLFMTQHLTKPASWEGLFFDGKAYGCFEYVFDTFYTLSGSGNSSVCTETRVWDQGKLRRGVYPGNPGVWFAKIALRVFLNLTRYTVRSHNAYMFS